MGCSLHHSVPARILYPSYANAGGEADVKPSKTAAPPDAWTTALALQHEAAEQVGHAVSINLLCVTQCTQLLSNVLLCVALCACVVCGHRRGVSWWLSPVAMRTSGLGKKSS